MSNKLTSAQAWQLQEDLQLCHVWLELNCLADSEGWNRRLVDEVFELLRQAFRFSYCSELRSTDAELNPVWEELAILAEDEEWSSSEYEASSDLVQKAHQEGFFAAWEQKVDNDMVRRELGGNLHLSDDWFEADKGGLSIWAVFVVITLTIGVYGPMLWGVWTLWHYLF